MNDLPVASKSRLSAQTGICIGVVANRPRHFTFTQNPLISALL
jgi:hypothetical protein